MKDFLVCTECGVIDDSGLTPRTGSAMCDPHQWVEVTREMLLNQLNTRQSTGTTERLKAADETIRRARGYLTLGNGVLVREVLDHYRQKYPMVVKERGIDLDAEKL